MNRIMILIFTIYILSFVSLCGKAEEDKGTSKKDSVSKAIQEDVRQKSPAIDMKKEEKMVKTSPKKAREKDIQRNTEDYKNYGINAFTKTSADKYSTFSIDVDTASYTIVRRKLMEGTIPPKNAIRVEEFLNYFHYDYPFPKNKPFNVIFSASPSPFNKEHYFLRVGVQGKKVTPFERKPVHLTFLVDTSGSMNSADKMGLLKRSLRILVDSLNNQDTVALCTYAGSVREVLRPTSIKNKLIIHNAIEQLTAGGSTAMSSGIELAYKLSAQNIVEGHVNRVIVCSDGDANVGPVSHEQILEKITEYKEKGITLSTIGFGMGNYKDTMMEQLANKGNGNYFYIDNLSQAKRVFHKQLGSALEVIAKDVKIQLEFNPAAISEYRLVGYENRDIADKDFRDDKVDAGELGAGHSVTALYEVKIADKTKQLGVLRMRAKKPDGKKADETEYKISPNVISKTFTDAPRSYRFAVGVGAFAEKLRLSPAAKDWKYKKIREIVSNSIDDEYKEGEELLKLIDKTINLQKPM